MGRWILGHTITNLSPPYDLLRCPQPGSTRPVGNCLFRPPLWGFSSASPAARSRSTVLKDKGTGTGGHPTPTPQPFLFSGRVSSRIQAGLIRSKPLKRAGLGRCGSEACCLVQTLLFSARRPCATTLTSCTLHAPETRCNL